MANKTLFKTYVGNLLPKTDVVNEAGGRAYSFSDEHALAQYAVTGCLNATFYAGAEQQLDKVIEMCDKVSPEYIAKTALYARQVGYMKDMPALLCAILSVKSPGLMAEIFDRVINNTKMLRNFVQIMRSGVVGRKSLGTLPKRMILQWLENKTATQLFIGAIGQNPSLADIVKMVHPNPESTEKEALYGYLIGKDYDFDSLPEIVKQYEKFKCNTNPLKAEVPDVPFQYLTALQLAKSQWAEIARTATWQTTRMNLNTFARHGVFEVPNIENSVVKKLRDSNLIKNAKVFPYQLMAAYMNASYAIPRRVVDSLQDAMDIALRNVPKIKGKVYVFPDVSGSMHWPVTGYRKGASTKVRCIDAAGMIASAILFKNKSTEIIPFSDDVVNVRLNSRDSVITNANKLASLPSGGTNCSAPLKALNDRKAKGDLVIYVSDNESWVDSQRGCWGNHGTETMKQWNLFKKRNPDAKMICIDIQAVSSTQAKERRDIINVGGFSDQVFNLIAYIASGKADKGFWVNEVESQVI